MKKLILLLVLTSLMCGCNSNPHITDYGVVRQLEAYPPHYQKLAGDGYFDMSLEKREGYIQGYDQAMQDFLEKALEWLDPTLKSIAGYNCGGDLINDFKNYMQNERLL